MRKSAESYEFLFEQSGEICEDAFERLRHRDVANYRAKTIKSGDVLEVEIFPIWKTGNQAKEAKRRTTKEAQKKLNEKNAKKKFIRKINANFSSEDLSVTLTYRDEAPDEQQARKDIRNYIRRIREWRRKHGMSELKYAYVMEYGGKDGRRKRVHHHIIMSGIDRDTAEKLWGKGYANAHRLQPDDYGMEALARYMLKEPKGGKRWAASKNLVDPKITESDTKISKRKVERMAQDFEEVPARIFGKLFPGYTFDACQVRFSAFVSGAYVYAHMHREAKEKGDHANGKSQIRNCKKPHRTGSV